MQDDRKEGQFIERMAAMKREAEAMPAGKEFRKVPMSRDKRAEIVEAMARGLHDFWQNAPGSHARSWEETCEKFPPMAEHFRRKAVAALDIALKAAAEIARNACLVPPDGGAPTKTESEMCDRAADAILALTSEGEKP